MIPSVALNREILLEIGEQHRVLDDDIVSDAVPDQFVELLARLEIRPQGPRKNAPASSVRMHLASLKQKRDLLYRPRAVFSTAIASLQGQNSRTRHHFSK